ncbi:MAG: acyl-CoA dehydrogenase family protein, partial [Pseudomonadota bacterium]
MELSEEHRLIKEAVRRFTQNEITPLAEEIDRKDYFPPDFFKKCGELGFLGPTVSEEYGGLGSDPLTHVLIAEELAQGSGGLALSYIAHSNLCTHNLYKNGTDIIRKKYVPDLCSGE